jgi:ferrous iron transport protein B
MIETSVQALPLITLLGHPNSGKTTLFNLLSGKKYKTVNYPGSTVEYSISRILGKYEINANILDSPGIISLIPCSPDEKISVDTVYSHPKYGQTDIAVITVDASQLSRQLLLVRQMTEANFRVIIALTMNDILHKKGLDISAERLSSLIGCDVVKIDGRSGNGIDNLLKVISKNMEELKLNGAGNGATYHSDHSKEKILSSFREIEDIEKEVIFEVPGINYNGQAKLIKLEEVNKKINILNNPFAERTRKPDETSLKIDKIVLHKFWGIVIFIAIMSLTFTSIFWLAAPVMDLIDTFFGTLSEGAFTLLGDNWFGDLIANGVIAGLGSVLVFLPQILILFLILGLLEDSGYLARGAMLIDRPLAKIGLNGRSFVPLLSGFACAIPAMMATRTISNKRERFLTIFIIPLMSCSARLPVYALLLAFLIPREKPWLAGAGLAVIYIFSIASSVIVAGIVNKFKDKLVKEEDNSSFIIELPTYKPPKLRTVFFNMYKNANQYVKKAGPVIIYLSLILWFLTSFPNYNPEISGADTMRDTLDEGQYEEMVSYERLSTSYAAQLGNFIEPVMRPIGMDWRVGVSMIATFAAREVFVSSMALIFHVTGTEDDEEKLQESILSSMRDARIESTGEKLFTASTIAGLIVFFVFALQCLSTVAISKKETGGWRIPILQVVVFTGIAYVLMFVTVHGMRLMGFE